MDERQIERERLYIEQQLEENIEHRGSAEEHEALSRRWEELTDMKDQIRTAAATPQGKTVAEKLKAKEQLIASLEVEPPNESFEDRIRRLTKLVKQRELASEMERHAPFAGRATSAVEAELLEARAAREEAKATLAGSTSTGAVPQDSARAQLAHSRIADLDRKVGELKVELTNRENARLVNTARDELIRKRAMREATEEHRRKTTAALVAAREQVKRREASQWYADKAFEEYNSPVPKSLIDQKLQEAQAHYADWGES